MADLTALAPASFGVGKGSTGTLVAGTRVQIQDDNSGAGTTAVLSLDLPTPRTHPFCMYRTGHVFNWGSNDSVGVGADTSASDDTHPNASAWFTGTSLSTAHVTATSGGGIMFCLFSATSHQRVFDVVFRIPVLSTAAQQFRCRFGFPNAFFGSITNGAYLEIDSFVQATAQLICTANSVTTNIDTGFTIVANTWYRARVVVTNNTQVDAYIAAEGSALPSTPTATSSTNIPSGTTQGVSVNAMMESIAGTVSKESDNLYFFCGMDRYAA